MPDTKIFAFTTDTYGPDEERCVVTLLEGPSDADLEGLRRAFIAECYPPEELRPGCSLEQARAANWEFEAAHRQAAQALGATEENTELFPLWLVKHRNWRHLEFTEVFLG